VYIALYISYLACENIRFSSLLATEDVFTGYFISGKQKITPLYSLLPPTTFGGTLLILRLFKLKFHPVLLLEAFHKVESGIAAI